MGIWLIKARDALLKAGIQVTTNEQQINIYALKSDVHTSPSPVPSPSGLPPSPSQSSSQQPIPTQEPQQTLSLPAEIIFPVAVAIGTAVIVAVILLLRRRWGALESELAYGRWFNDGS